MEDLEFRTLTPDLAEQCAALERQSFPHAEAADLLSADDIRAYARTFPEGFIVCLAGDRVVGQGAGIFLDFDFVHPQHTLAEITGEQQCANHDPEGEWYYGTDIAVHPDYRRRGIGRRLYELRKELVRRCGKQGIIAGGYMPGFARHRHRMSAAAYAEAVSRGVLYDPTLTFQLENGFEVEGMLQNYMRDEATGGWAALIVWRSPEVG